MQCTSQGAADAVEEMRLRRWARENYVAAAHRNKAWHPLVLDEMRHRDEELTAAASYADVARRVVPLVPDHGRHLRGPHIEPVRPAVLLRVPTVH